MRELSYRELTTLSLLFVRIVEYLNIVRIRSFSPFIYIYIYMTNFDELVWTYRLFVEIWLLTYLQLFWHMFQNYHLSRFRHWRQGQFKWSLVLYLKLYISQAFTRTLFICFHCKHQKYLWCSFYLYYNESCSQLTIK